MAEQRLERADSIFTGTTKFKVVAELTFEEDLVIQVNGEGTASPREGVQTMELSCAKYAGPINLNIIGTIIQTNLRAFTGYTGSNLYDFFKTSFPGSPKTEIEAMFVDGAIVSGSCTLSFVKSTLMCRFKLAIAGVSEDSPARSPNLKETLTCFEVLDEGAKKGEVMTSVDLTWEVGTTGGRYSCRMDTRAGSGDHGAPNFTPPRHFIGHHFKVLEHTPDNRHFAQRLKSRATSINYFKNQ
uniref:Putative nonfluorescent protein n=1 Tax=Hormiphora californensis TaxID=1403702 RepID=A0A1C8YXN4_HORCA|nr:putative nonfluorescent protein [Hormiphora californensis]